MSDEDPNRGRGEPSLPTARELAMVLFRRRRVFVCVAGLVLAAAALYAATGTSYHAKMKVLVRRERADAPVSAGENAPLDLTRIGITEEELNSEVELLRDEEVLRRVVAETGAGGRDWLHFLRMGEGHAQVVERAARRLAKQIKIAPVKKTNLIAISYAAGDPQVAARVLQSLSSEYLEKHKALHRPHGESTFFEQQTAASRQEFEDSKRRLLQFAATHGVIAAGQQRDLALQKMNEMDARCRQARIELAETQQRVTELTNVLQRLPQRATTQVRSADNAELLKSLKATLLDLGLKKTQLLTKFEPNHPLVQEVNEQIAQTQSAIIAESVAPLRDETTDKNPHYEWAKAELQQAEVQLEGLRARAWAAERQAAAYRAIAEKLGTEAVTQDDLLSREKAAQESYLLYVKKQEEARMNDALDERGIVNVAIAERPVVPALPVRSAWTVLTVGLVAAAAAGTGSAFAAEYLDPAFRDPDDVVAYLNAPVVASLPKGLGRSCSA
jgi:uncharacterized protein involved in exopolysaccharide biosynthesis